MGKRYRSGVGRLLPEIEAVVAPHGYHRCGHVFNSALEGGVVHFLLPRKVRTGDFVIDRGFYVPRALELLKEEIPEPEAAPVGWAQGALGSSFSPRAFAESLEQSVAGGQASVLRLATVQDVVDRWSDSQFWAYEYGASIFPSPRDSAWLAGCFALLGRPEEGVRVVEEALTDESVPANWRPELTSVRNLLQQIAVD